MKTACLISSGGCDPFETDLGLIKIYLRNNKYALSKKIEKADLIIVHTCAFSKNMENISVKLLENALQKQSQNAKVIVTGCLSSINKTRCDRIFNGPKVSADALQDLDKIINPKIKLCDIARIDFPRYLKHNNIYWLRIGWGCLGKCSYCAVKLVFSRLKSRSVLGILREFNNAYADGYRNFSLVAQEVGVYGKDCNMSLVDLLRMLCDEHADCTFRLVNIAPNMLKSLLPLLEKFIRLGKISSMVIPIQSGSNRIIRLMKRQYTLDELKDLIKKVKEYNPNLKIKTDIMVGFPSETMQDFLDTLKLVEWLGRYEVVFQSFEYSKRPNTEAGKMLDQIDKKTKNNRLKRLNRVIRISRILNNKKLFKRLKRQQI